jgi:trans-aconitate methyltransferase
MPLENVRLKIFLISCLEYGCGTGRVTLWLVERFSPVYGYDISKSHLKIAKEKVPGAKFCQIKSIHDLNSLPEVDFVYSIIVLQHNPPPVIEYILSRLLRCLTPGGVALFQVPTYLPNYTFSIKQYLNQVNPGMEMHAIPQATIYKVISEEGCIPVYVTTDASIMEGISNKFLVRKQI